MNCDHDDLLEGTTWEFPHTGFWLVHTIAPLLIFMLGARFAARRAPVLPLVAWRIIKMLRQR